MAIIAITVVIPVLIISLTIICGLVCVCVLFIRPKFGRIICDSCCCCCGLSLMWTIIGILLSPLFVIVAILLLLLFLVYLSGDVGLQALYSVVATIWNAILVFIGIYNPLSTTLPLLATVINTLLKLFKLFIMGVLGLGCTKLPFIDADFDPVVHCSTLFSWLSIVPFVAQILSDVIAFIVNLLDLLSFALLPGTCVGELLTCSNMCSDLGLPDGCFSATNAITWIFTCEDSGNLLTCHIWEFLINTLDFFFLQWGFFPAFKYIANQIGAVKLVKSCSETFCYTPGPAFYTNYNLCIINGFCTDIVSVFQLLTVLVESNFDLFSHFFIALGFHYILSPIATVLCVIHPNAISACLGELICLIALTPIGFGYLCPEKICPCFDSNCINGWGLQSVCTFSPQCSCDFTYIDPFVSFIYSFAQLLFFFSPPA